MIKNYPEEKKILKFIYDPEEMDQKDYENFISWRSEEEVQDLKENWYTDSWDPDYVYDPNGKLVCIFENFYNKYILIQYEEDEKAIEAIKKFFNKDPEEVKYLDDDRNWETIRKAKDPDVYTVAYRWWSGYSYWWWIYKID